MKTEDINPAIGTAVHVDKAALRDDEVARRCLELLDQRGVLVFPRIGLNDDEQLAFTDKLGARVNFTSRVPGGNKSTQDVYTITLDPKINTEPEYVLGTYFWHMDGLTSPIIPPKASVLSARTVAPKGGQTEFASSYAAYEALPEEDKSDLEGLRVIHSVTAAARMDGPMRVYLSTSLAGRRSGHMGQHWSAASRRPIFSRFRTPDAPDLGRRRGSRDLSL
jgi:alpha-ketoglutarate-dependent taurine dioxygenase